MDNFNEMIDLSHRLSAVLDDMGEVTSIDFTKDGRVRVLASSMLFLEQFALYDVEDQYDSEFLMKLTTELDGILFICLLHKEEEAEQIATIRKSLPATAIASKPLEQTFYSDYA
ncbi:hypothetical protein [Sporosarcina cyprini]|uniref:hypothetical protein n=1 Tax=Sporosarcina cyprini TaxID=2910523 RepID=UPI001EDE227C|nr:hypothetical protein [Sporosarcina cyprini]MCG3089163.1 hypothetical protein [Sporosarcina cyprini]